MTLILGAVAYDPKVVTIWNGFRAWLRAHDLPFDYVLYSHYERQVEDLLAGRLHVAWNSPLAWVRAERLARAAGREVRPLVMRDTDRDLRSVLLVRADSPCAKVAELQYRTVGLGAVDSPQATLLPTALLREAGLVPGGDVTVRRFDTGVGLHGDHIGGERDAARALIAGEVDAAAVVDTNVLLFGREGTLPAGSTRVLARTGAFDHCNLSAVDTAPADLVDRLGELLLSMSYADPEVRPLFDLEGLREWREGRTSGYARLAAAVDDEGFYDGRGRVTARGYSP
ncbi:phosphate/phosphite/phosphonate ABC transporter substrate-binding protein [Saccharothrix australiensis]|uniref:ABC-type phosphate/phosphonate transport system substrate-binding protein n=1 Tax=Saccharothrix australiensis TaxID=2072 RepID=A0A495VZW7_9PSEU|nr:PhnD/SsuA/transferrin family substrate-binding protein [Saccharothrix australiensis]RKT54420.1 ABC-type phosphate/phosphonate transport system substrate-binding protein [Saccharothrix australiensis]